jgi:apolipoprotein N-acyltransferase
MIQNFRINTPIRNALSALIGIGCAFSMSPTSIWLLMLLGMGGLYWLFSKTKSPLDAFGLGFFFAQGYFVTGLWWIGNALLVEGNEFAWVWPLSVIGLPTLLALFTGLYMAITRMLGDPVKLTSFLGFVVLLTFSEIARGYAFTGFPWNLYGYAWSQHLPMAQGFAIFGAYGMTLLTIFWGAGLGFLALQKNARFMVSFFAVIAISMLSIAGGGAFRLSKDYDGYDLSTWVAVVQPNIEQSMKWDADKIDENFQKLLFPETSFLGTKERPENILIIWPETAIFPSIYNKPENLDRIRDMMTRFENHFPPEPVSTYLITGVLRRETKDDKTTFHNSVVMFNESMSAVDIYDKTHLVPFGEFIPFQDIIPLTPVAQFNGFERGDGVTTIARDTVPPYSPLVCYEIIFPGKVADMSSTPKPRMIVNVTNDGWYGDSAGPHQHFDQSRLRAIEEGLPVLRSANTGVSGIIDPYGRVLQSLPIGDHGVIWSTLPNPANDALPQIANAIQVLIFIFGFGLLLICAFMLHKRNVIYNL